MGLVLVAGKLPLFKPLINNPGIPAADEVLKQMLQLRTYRPISKCPN
jgi:hypothetical protein